MVKINYFSHVQNTAEEEESVKFFKMNALDIKGTSSQDQGNGI